MSPYKEAPPGIVNFWIDLICMQVVCQPSVAGDGADAAGAGDGDEGGDDPNKPPWRERALAELL